MNELTPNKTFHGILLSRHLRDDMVGICRQCLKFDLLWDDVTFLFRCQLYTRDAKDNRTDAHKNKWSDHESDLFNILHIKVINYSLHQMSAIFSIFWLDLFAMIWLSWKIVLIKLMYVLGHCSSQLQLQYFHLSVASPVYILDLIQWQGMYCLWLVHHQETLKQFALKKCDSLQAHKSSPFLLYNIQIGLDNRYFVSTHVYCVSIREHHQWSLLEVYSHCGGVAAGLNNITPL